MRTEAASLTPARQPLHHDLDAILRAGVRAVDAGELVRAALARTAFPLAAGAVPAIVAAGKAACPMLTAVIDAFPGAVGVAAAPEGCPPPEGWAVFAAGHPWPNAGSVQAGAHALTLARGAQGTLLVLLSGGASAMLCAPAPGLTLEDKSATSRALMASGAAIDELNCVRKHLSRIKGGQLAAAAGRTLTLALSDVHAPLADDPSVIGSGPTVPDPTTFRQALDVIQRRQVSVSAAVTAHLERGVRGGIPETPKPGDPRLAASEYLVIGNRHVAVEGARREAARLGYQVVTLDEATLGEARDAGGAWVAAAGRAARQRPGRVCVIGSGETTVTVRGAGRGGRNQEFVLGAARQIAALAADLDREAVLASAGTDGVDGPTDAAGAMVDRTTLSRARACGLDAEASLEANDAYRYFDALDDLILWGPTGTNVGDLHVLLMTAARTG